MAKRSQVKKKKKATKKATKKAVKKVAKKATKQAAKKVAASVAGRAALGAVPIAGPALVALTTLGTQMKKGSALANFLKNAKDNKFIGSNTRKKETPKALPKAMSPGPKKKKKLSGISGKQKIENEKRANIREAGRGKVGPKRNVIKTSTGILRDKSGKAVTRLSREEILKRRKANR